VPIACCRVPDMTVGVAGTSCRRRKAGRGHTEGRQARAAHQLHRDNKPSLCAH